MASLFPIPSKKRTLFKSGAKKFDAELDWASILNSIRQLKLMVNILMTKNQQNLMKFDNSKVILEKNSTLEKLGEDELIKDIPTHGKKLNKEVLKVDSINKFIDELKYEDISDIDNHCIKHCLANLNNIESTKSL